jgi:hypothetical protein
VCDTIKIEEEFGVTNQPTDDPSDKIEEIVYEH